MEAYIHAIFVGLNFNHLVINTMGSDSDETVLDTSAKTDNDIRNESDASLSSKVFSILKNISKSQSLNECL